MPELQTYSDAFISYRRLNVEFVKQFVDELKANGKEVWVDWEDIPPGSESFTDDIQRGIEGADAFIAILSPDYLQSTYTVDLELQYAIDLNKKVIPVVYEKFEDSEIPAGVGHINWIYFTPHAGQDNTFEESFPRVLEALDVDFAYVRDHTRLLQRAREWHANNEHSSYLLTGEEIVTAEAWLAKSATKTPDANVLHYEFIQASRLRENQIARRNFSIAIGVMVLSIVLAGFALLQWQEADEQRGIAEEQRAIAIDERDRAAEQQRLSDSRRLSVQSLVARELGEIDVSLLLGLEALQSAETVEAIGSLVSAFENSPYLETYLYDHATPLSAVAYHPSDQLAVTTGDDGSMVMWDMDTQSTQWIYDADDNEIWDIAFHPDGSYFVTARVDGSLTLHDTETGNLNTHIENAHQGIVTSANFNEDGSLLVTTSYDATAIIWQADTLIDDDPQFSILTTDDSETTHFDWIMDTTWSPDGAQVALITWDNVLQIWDVLSGDLIFDPLQLSIGTGNFSISVTWSPDGRLLLLGDVLGTIRFVDAGSGQLIDFQLSRHIDHIREMVYHPSGTYFASVSHDGSLILWASDNGQPITEAPIYVHGNHVNGVAFSSDGEQMVTVGDDGRVVLFDMTQPDLLADHILSHESEIYQVMYTDDTIFSVGLDGNVYQTDPTTLESSVLFSPEIGRFTAADLSEDGALLALATDAGVVQVWDMMTNEPLGDSFVAHTASIFGIAFRPDGTQLATSGDDSLVRLWNVDDLRNNTTESGVDLSGHEDGLFDVAWHPTEPIIASASRDTTIRLWDVETGNTIATLFGHNDDVETLLFNPTGDMLVSGGRDNNILLWDAETALSSEDIAPTLLGTHNDWVLALDFHPDANLLVSGGRDRSIILWDIPSLQSIGGALTHHQSWVWSVAISPDGQIVASGGRDYHLVLWDINQANWQTLACRIANRSFDEVEWTQYRPSEDYRETCEI